MQASVKIMDIDVDMLSNDIFIQKMNEYLTDDRLDVILFASTLALNRAVEDQDYCELLNRAELLLPGEEALLTTHHVDVLEAGDMVVSCKSFGIVLENLQKQDRTVYIVAKDHGEVAALRRYCKKAQPKLRIVGEYAFDQDAQDAAVINEINSHTPDLLLVSLNTGEQEEWIMGHVPQLNARICVAIGGVESLILAEQRKAPAWVKKLHLEKLFHWAVRDQNVKKGVRARRFRKTIEQYDNER